MNLRVLHIADKWEGGGAESVFRSSVIQLRKMGKGTHWLACQKNKRDDVSIDLVFPSNPALSSAIYSSRNERLLNLFLQHKQPDIIHVHNFGELSPSILQAIFRYKQAEQNKGNAVHIIHTSHSFLWVCSHLAALDYRRGNPCLDCLKDQYRTRIFARGCSRGGYIHSVGKGLAALQVDHYLKKGLFDYCLTPSDFASDLVRRRFPAQLVKTVRNPLSAVLLDTADDTSFQEKENRIVYFGRLSKEKNLPLLLEAFELLRQQREYSDTILEFIGEGEEQELLQQMINEKNISNTFFTGFLPQEQLKKQLQRAKVAVVPSVSYETAGLIIPESICQNIIPVVTGHGALKESVELFGCGLCFQYNNKEDLARQIGDAIFNYTKYSSLFEKSKKKIGELMNEGAYVTQLMDIYKEYKI